MAQLDLFIVNIAFPSIERDFAGSSNGSLSWVLNAYAIVFAACLVPAGRLGDLLGRRRTFELGLAVFALGSAGCAAAPGRRRARRGPRRPGGRRRARHPDLARAAAARLPGRRRAPARSAPGRRSARSPPPAGRRSAALLVEVDWRLIFLVNLPLAAGALVASRRVLEEVRHPERAACPTCSASSCSSPASAASCCASSRAPPGAGRARRSSAASLAAFALLGVVPRGAAPRIPTRSSSSRCCAAGPSRSPTDRCCCSTRASARCCSTACCCSPARGARASSWRGS